MGGDCTLSGDCVAVTGATGFVGKAVLKSLQDAGYQWRALTRQTLSGYAETQWVQGDLENDAALRELFTGADTVIHIAGATKAVSRNGFLRVNAIGAFDVAAQAHACGVKHFILISSLAATQPEISAYAASKAAGETAVQVFASKMQVTIIRPPAVVGSGDPMLAPLFAMLKHGYFPALSEPRSGARVFSVISVSDLAQEIVSSMRAETTSPNVIEPFSVQRVTWKQVHSAAQDVLGRKIKRVPLPPFLLKMVGSVADLVCLISRQTMPISGGKARELLIRDWTSNTSVESPMRLHDIIAECLGASETSEQN